MIPLGDDNDNRIVPYVTYSLIALNVFVFILDWLGFRAVQHWSMIPYSVVHDLRVEPKIIMGNIVGFEKLPAVGPHPQWITIFTSMFMHGGFMHIIGNMWFLWIFGDNIENTLGHFKYALFYIACGVLAALAHISASMSSMNAIIPTVGASGAIAGVLGAYMILYPGNRIRTLIMLPFFWSEAELSAVYFLAVWFILQFTGVLGGNMQGGGVAYWAHIGGFVAGIILVLLMGGRKSAQTRMSYREQRNRLSNWEE